MEALLLVDVSMVANASSSRQLTAAVFRYYSVCVTPSLGYFLDVAPNCFLSRLMPFLLGLGPLFDRVSTATIPKGTSIIAVSAELVIVIGDLEVLTSIVIHMASVRGHDVG